MTPLRIFISSVQKEFTAERVALRDYLHGDALICRFFEPFSHRADGHRHPGHDPSMW